MNAKKVFLRLRLAGLVALGSTNFCLGMEVESPKPYDMSSSEESSEVDDIDDAIQKLDDANLLYGPLETIKSFGWKACWGDPRELTQNDIKICKNNELNTQDQGWTIFRIIRTLVKSQKILDQSKKQHGPPGSQISRELNTAITLLNDTIDFHKKKILAIIMDFDEIAAHRLFWLLIHKYSSNLADNKDNFYLSVKPLIAKKNYSKARQDWIGYCKQNINVLDGKHKNSIKGLLTETICLPFDSTFYQLLGIK